MFQGSATDVPGVCNRCSMSMQPMFPWACNRCSMGMQPMFHGHATDVPWACNRCSMGMQPMFHGHVTDVPWACKPMFQGPSTDVPWACNRCSMGMQPMFQGHATDVPGELDRDYVYFRFSKQWPLKSHTPHATNNECRNSTPVLPPYRHPCWRVFQTFAHSGEVRKMRRLN